MATHGTRRLECWRGTLCVGPVRRGTASQQQALLLETEHEGRFVLIKLGGPSFGLPPEAAWDGASVEVEGYRLGRELRFTRLERR
jgi:hypothetical protein